MTTPDPVRRVYSLIADRQAEVIRRRRERPHRNADLTGEIIGLDYAIYYLECEYLQLKELQ